jgi:hypothetical protein
MCQTFLNDANFYALLLQIDQELAAPVQGGGCRYCGGKLHRADYPRKPRGVARRVLGEGYERRISFCCAEAGCRCRMTPASVRFLGRRVYLGVIVVLSAVLSGGVTAKRARYLGEHLGVGGRTLERWRRWWREGFVGTPFWQWARGYFSPPPRSERLPASLLECFAAEGLAGQVIALLRFIAPLSTVGAIGAQRQGI